MCNFMTRCGPQTEYTFERFVCCNLRIHCPVNACVPKTVLQQRSIPHCQGNVLSESPPSRRSYSGSQASCHNFNSEVYCVVSFKARMSESELTSISRQRLGKHVSCIIVLEIIKHDNVETRT
jgi:hypothetical protein